MMHVAARVLVGVLCLFGSFASVSAGGVVTNPNSPQCFRDEVSAALRDIRDTGPQEIRTFLQQLDASNKSCIVTFSVGINHHRTGEVFWNPDSGGSRFQDGVCVDSKAALVHELWHCYVYQLGTAAQKANQRNFDLLQISGVSFPTRYPVARGEIEATEAENVYRRAVTPQPLCKRTTYGYGVLPGVVASTDPKCAPGGTPFCPDPITKCTNVNVCCLVVKLPTNSEPSHSDKVWMPASACSAQGEADGYDIGILPNSHCGH